MELNAATDQGFMAGVAAATQNHNAQMQCLLGSAFNPQQVPYMNGMVANNFPHNQTNHYGLGNQGLMQNNMPEDPFVQAVIYEAMRNNTSISNVLFAFRQSQARAAQEAQLTNAAAAIQREMRANSALEAIRRHQGMHDATDKSNVAEYLLLQHQSNVQLDRMISNGATADQIMAFLHSSGIN
jgi:hypothetical protein